MNHKDIITKLFAGVLGIPVEIEETVINKELIGDPQKDAFVKSIDFWGNAWKQQNTLFNKYGINLEGYDNLLYSSLENLLMVAFGDVRAQIILSFIYSEIDHTEDQMKIIDKNGKEFYVGDSAGLYEFVIDMNIEDFIIE